jgi:uncharacterized protein YecT (DUF1311 family)
VLSELPMTRLFAAALLLLAAAPAVHAQRPADTRERCDRQGGSNPGLMQCLSGPRIAEDARLNRAYKAAMARLKTPAQKLTLRDAQRAWIKDRDAECLPFYDEAQYGQQGRLDGEACVARRSGQRADDLERIGRR